MLFYWFNRNKTIKDLRKNVSLTTKELAEKLNWHTREVNKIEELSLKELPKEIRQELIPIFRQDDLGQ
ncbi:hypothetical protein SAMN05446037_101027 [Anaerovirgula multivorans]|uniref:Uncharacterized protein n=1 Tax=Anaerovirgula multivorans TaxID=312168 RepID=A0A239EGQ9_9FIRM|nr:hypothetical protein [Anaerovirgula multivorans]SNS43836.1 hypothetical protein SAMN05446037_101027 [Anaerovirgula multivorans]